MGLEDETFAILRMRQLSWAITQKSKIILERSRYGRALKINYWDPANFRKLVLVLRRIVPEKIFVKTGHLSGARPTAWEGIES